MNNQASHTPTPLQSTYDRETGICWVYNAERTCAAAVTVNAAHPEQFLAHIVHAVNSHAQLINALENLAAAMENVLLHNKPMGTGDLAGRAAMVEEARAALSQAKGE